MNNNQYTYNQPPMGQMMPPQPGAPRPRGWRERWMRRFGMNVSHYTRKDALIIPHWLSGQALAFFFVSMFVCWGAYGYVPNLDLIITACVSIVLFFYGTSSMSRVWKQINERRFLKYIFITGIIVRLGWVAYMYYMFNPNYYGNTYGDTADVDWYISFGKDLSLWLAGDSKYALTDIIDMLEQR